MKWRVSWQHWASVARVSPAYETATTSAITPEINSWNFC